MTELDKLKGSVKHLLIIGIVLVVVGLLSGCADSIESWAKEHTNFVDFIGVLVNLIIGTALFYVGWEANKIATASTEQTEQSAKEFKANLHETDKAVIRANYSKVSEALSLILQEGCVKDDSMRLLWQARDEARLELPEPIMDYTESLREKAQKAWAINKFLYDREGNVKNANHRNRDAKIEEEHKLLLDFMEEEPHKVYRSILEIRL